MYEDLHDYTLDELVALARERGLVDGFQKVGHELEIRVDHDVTVLDHETAKRFMRSVIHAWLVGTGSLPPRTSER